MFLNNIFFFILEEKFSLLDESIAATMPSKLKVLNLSKEVKCTLYDQRKPEALNCSQSGIDWDEDSHLFDEDDCLSQKSQVNLNFQPNENLFLQHSANDFDGNDNSIKNNTVFNNSFVIEFDTQPKINKFKK